MNIFKKDICAFCGQKYSSFWHKNCPHCDNIDFENILYCRIDNTEMTYHTEERLHWRKYYYDGSFHREFGSEATGKQDENMLGRLPGQTFIYKGTIKFSFTQ